MTSVRLLCYPAAVLLLLSASSLCSPTATKSLWGQRLKFKGPPCLWQLRPEAVIPALEELSVCILVKRLVPTKWTGFVYKAPGNREVELGLGGSGNHLTVWLFGKEWNFQLRMTPREWYYFCITWSGKAQRLKIYINGKPLDEAVALPTLSRQLAPNGTLSLGVSHFSVNGEVERESGTDLVGEISLFRVWGRAYGADELKRLSCVDGDVVSWAKDLQQRKYDCPPEPDGSLQCVWSHYKIEMQTSIVQSNYSSNCPRSPERITDSWLKLIFPDNISVLHISVSSPSHPCYMVNNSTPPQAQQPQGLDAQLNSSCDKCFSCEVFVHVHPAAKVDVAQAHMTALLNLNSPSKFLNLIADPDTIAILPVGLLATDFPPTVGTAASGEHPTPGLPPRPTNVPTTGESLDPNETAVEADHFFKVNLTLNMTDSPTNAEDTIENWLKNQLEQNNTMTVMNPIIKDISGKDVKQYVGLLGGISHRKQKQFECTFHVQVYNTIGFDQAISDISTSLRSQYENGSIIITTMALDINHIIPGNCLEEQTNSTFYGDYFWPETFPQVEAEMICWKPGTGRAYRLCKLDIKTDMSSWAEPDLTDCELLVTISDLDNVTVTPGNADEVVDAIQELVNVALGNSEELSPSNLNSVVEKLSEVVDISVIGRAVGVDIVNIIAEILNSKTYVTRVAETILNLAERMGHNMDIQDESLSITAPSLALSMINAEPDQFTGLTFGVSSVSSTLNPEIFLNRSFAGDPLPETVATISLPSALRNLFQPGEKNTTRVQFQFYATQELFEDPANSTDSNWRVASYVVSASINNSHVINLPLEDRVVVTLTHQPLQQPEHQVQCMFWDVHMNDGRSGWNGSGCETRSVSPSQTSCLCDHLTHFALLLDVSGAPISETDSQILTIISYLGCGISCIFLGVTLLTYFFFEKLRRDYPSKILINLSAALLGLSMVFLVNSWLSSFSNYGLCIATAATLHYFLLASFTWMGLEAVHMYLALVKVFNTYIPSYILKFCAVGWGIPLVIVSLVLAIDKDVYGGILPEDAVITPQSTGPFCWLKNDACFYVTVMAFILLILLGNVFVFIVVLIQIRRTRANKPSDTSRSALQDLRAVASLTVLLGLTWSMGLFSFGPGRVTMMYLFVIFNSFQGLFVFLFHCLMKENVRKQWRTDLCCGRFRVKTFFSDRSSQTNGGPTKMNNLNNSNSLFSDSTTGLGSSATFSSNKHCHQGA